MTASTNIYDYPHYYEVAFGFRNIPREMRFFDEAIRRFSRIPVRRVLELASGTSPYLEGWHARQVQYLGLDRNRKMLSHVRKRVRQGNLRPKLFLADMNKFVLSGYRVDLAYVLVGSLFSKSTEEFFRHLDCVARVLRKGGLYVMDWVVWFNLLSLNRQHWRISRNGVRVSSTWTPEIVDAAGQVFMDRWVVRVRDGSRRYRLTSGQSSRFFFPQEFLALIRLHKKFRFMGWYDNFDFEKQP